MTALSESPNVHFNLLAIQFLQKLKSAVYVLTLREAYRNPALFSIRENSFRLWSMWVM